MKRIIFATKNVGKVRELSQMLKKYGVEVLSLLDINYENEIEENGLTFEENALIKARAIFSQYKTTVIADDSGLSIDALNGAPGVYSARYASLACGEGLTSNGNTFCKAPDTPSDNANMDRVLAELKDVPDNERTARFVCVLAIVDANGKEIVVRGTCEGKILHEKRGLEGFGYDPIFFLPQLNKTMAELSKDEKNALSHRGNAFKKLEFELVAGEII